jgi:hypothetical protein
MKKETICNEYDLIKRGKRRKEEERGGKRRGKRRGKRKEEREDGGNVILNYIN